MLPNEDDGTALDVDANGVFLVTNPEDTSKHFPDNNTIVTMGGRSCRWIHSLSQHNNDIPYGDTVQFQVRLDERTDMSGEDYRISIEFFVPSLNNPEDAGFYWTFFDEGYTPIVSPLYSAPRDVWNTIAADVTMDGITVAYIPDSPEGWLFDGVRASLETFEENVEISYCVASVRVTRTVRGS